MDGSAHQKELVLLRVDGAWMKSRVDSGPIGMPAPARPGRISVAFVRSVELFARGTGSRFVLSWDEEEERKKKIQY